VIRHSTYLQGRHHAPSPLVLSSVGLAFLVVASRWLAIAPGQLVEYPGDLNQTAVAKGTVTLYLDPATGRPLSTPQPLPLTIQRNLRVVESTGSWASVQETSTERVGALGPERLAQRYTLDRGTLENLADRGSYAHTTLNAIDRTGVYSINFPFSTSDGSYLLYKNETGTAYAFRRSGSDIERYGPILVPMRGRLTGVPATAAYLAQLAGRGIRQEMTLSQLARQLKAKGVDVAALSEKLLPALSAADRWAVQSMLTATVPIKYLVSADTRLLVEPTTGAIVSLADVNQMLTAVPDLTAFTKLATLLASPSTPATPSSRAR